MRNLEEIAKQVRKDIINMSYRAQSAHTGGALSCVEILVSLYFNIMNIYPQNPAFKDRDRLIFSKGHDVKALYAVLAERGYFDKKILEGYEIDGGKLPGHNVRNSVPGVESSSGSLGHGLSIATGIAYNAKIKKEKYRVFAVLSDGECDEGSTWEAILFAGHHKLDNLVVIIDYNKLQGFGFTKDILDLEPFLEKWEKFGWKGKEIDGHSFLEINKTLSALPLEKNKPTVVIAHTIKGKGGMMQHLGKISSQYKPPTMEDMQKLSLIKK